MDAFLTALITVLGGAVVLVVGQIAQRFVLEPIQEQRRVIGDIAHALTYYANVGGMSSDKAKTEVYLKTREMAARLRATLYTIPLYRHLARLGGVPVGNAVMEASVELVGWSNAVAAERPDDDVIHRRREEVAKHLRIPMRD